MTPTPTPEFVVPREPTDEMMLAAYEAGGRNNLRDVWYAMIAASPQPVVAPSDLSGEDGLSKTIPAAQSVAVRDIASERQRQIDAEGWSPGHDDEHDDFEMARAAACYARHATKDDDARSDYGAQENAPPDWPWGDGWWKPSEPRRDLIKAAALIVAEIERLDRAGAST